MSPTESPILDPIDGDLAEPPPSDLSEYTWDDSETQRMEPGAAESPAERAGAGRDRPIGDDIGRFVETLLLTGLVADAEIHALSARLFPAGEPPTVPTLAGELIRLRKLTPYQAAAIRQGKTKGLLIGNYVVLDKIASGGMGLVLRAFHRQHERVVALKLLPPSFSRDRAAVKRFRREAAAVARFRHPNLVSAIDSGETHGLLYLVMEFVEGRDLSRTVRETGPMSVAKAIDCIVQAARGLQEAHDHGIIHRDIKPANLLLDSTGVVKVLDLGLARVNQPQELVGADGSELELTISGSIVGTVDYMSPEQAFDPRLADGRSDIYSLGCTLHFLLTGKPPFGGQTFMERLLAHREQPIPSLRASRRDVSAGLDATFQSLLAKSPAARPATMADVVKELEKCRGSAPVKKPRRLKASDSPDDATLEREVTYELEQPAAAANESRPQALANVFVRSRTPSSQRRVVRTQSPSSRQRNPLLVPILAVGRALATLDFHKLRWVATVVLALLLGLMLAWRLLR
jgi:serine/threonine protein kinase